MLEEVDFDPAAATAAAAACEDAAAALEVRAELLFDASRGALAAWSGESAPQFDTAAVELASGLQAEAARLRTTAEVIEGAVVAAWAAEDRRVAEREAQKRAAEEAAADARRTVVQP